MNPETPSQPAARVPLKLSIEYRRNYARQEEEAHLRNISLTGAFLRMSAIDLNPEDRLVIHFKVAGRNRKVAARVVWKNGEGCGVRFEPLSNRDVQIVDDLMYFVESQRKTRKHVLDNIFQKIK